VYRVKTIYRNGTDRPIIERGPWHDLRKDAEHWAEQLRAAGYVVSIESQNIRSGGDDDNSDLAAALAGMA
jgi:hypothetical protein